MNVSLVLVAPQLNTVLQVGSHMSRERESPFLSSCSCFFFIQPMIKLTFWAASTHCWSCWASHQSKSQIFLSQSCSQSTLFTSCICPWDCPNPCAGHCTWPCGSLGGSYRSNNVVTLFYKSINFFRHVLSCSLLSVSLKS